MTDTTTPHAVPFLEDSDSLGTIAAWSESIAEHVNDNIGHHASGSAVLPFTAAGTTVTVAVTFPAGRFTTAPTSICVTPIISASGADDGVMVGVDTNVAVTASGCTLRGWRTLGTASVTVYWHAHQE